MSKRNRQAYKAAQPIPEVSVILPQPDPALGIPGLCEGEKLYLYGVVKRQLPDQDGYYYTPVKLVMRLEGGSVAGNVDAEEVAPPARWASHAYGHASEAMLRHGETLYQTGKAE